MPWWKALLWATLVFVGCRAPRPTFDPFAPYGPQCIPAPATGTIGAPGYYQPPVSTVPAPGVYVPPNQVGPSEGSTSRVPLQPVPSLGNQPQTQQPRTSARDEGNWESAARPGDQPPLTFGAGARHLRTRPEPGAVAQAGYTERARGGRDLVWIPPNQSRVVTTSNDVPPVQPRFPDGRRPPAAGVRPSLVPPPRPTVSSNPFSGSIPGPAAYQPTFPSPVRPYAVRPGSTPMVAEDPLGVGVPCCDPYFPGEVYTQPLYDRGYVTRGPSVSTARNDGWHPRAR